MKSDAKGSAGCAPSFLRSVPEAGVVFRIHKRILTVTPDVAAFVLLIQDRTFSITAREDSHCSSAGASLRWHGCSD